ncbi:hypothetical protein GCM10017778_66550 [Streptomyces vinaceus]|nr:hypothetical protein GCM10017778_66550 [Streptomyces vinaceus]
MATRDRHLVEGDGHGPPPAGAPGAAKRSGSAEGAPSPARTGRAGKVFAACSLGCTGIGGAAGGGLPRARDRSTDACRQWTGRGPGAVSSPGRPYRRAAAGSGWGRSPAR